MKFLHINQLNDRHKSQVRALWNKEYPVNILHPTQADFDNYLNKLMDQRHILFENEKGVIKGWYVDFIREKERWFAMIVDTELQGKGYGRALLTKGKEYNVALSGWVVINSTYLRKDGKPYQSPLEFYKKMGFQVFPEVRLKSDVLETIKIKWEGIPSKKTGNS